MLFYLFFVFLFSYTFGAPVASENSLSQTVTLGITTKSRLKREWNGNDSIKYLHQFGYLPPANLMTAGYGAPEMDTAQEKLREAIRRFQRIADIPETGVIDEATKEKMAKPRCGVPDVAALSYGKASIKWHKRELTWSIDDYSPDLSKEIIRKATKEAFNFWSQVAPLDFREVITDADIKIGFKVQQHRGCYYPFDGTGGVLAHALYPPNGQLHFDDDEKWTYKDAEKIRREYTDLLYVAIHEIGHTLGVDHLENKNSIMYFSYKEPIDVRGRYIEPTLHQVDIAAIQKIYGKRERAPAPALPTRRPANDEIEIGAADPVNHNGNDRPTDETPKSTSCPVKIDAIVADGSSTLIFDGNTLFIFNDQRRIVKQHLINEIFSDPPQQLEAAVLDHRMRKLIFFERGGTLHAYFHSNFFNRYLSAYKRRFDQYHHLTGAISFKSGAILLLDKNYKYATYDSRLGNSSEFKPIDFQNFPRNVRGAIKASHDESQLYLFTNNRVYLYNVDEEIVEKEQALSEWLNCR